MFVLAFALMIGLVAFFFSDFLERRQNPNQSLSSTVDEVVLKRNRYGHYVAPGAINGQPVVFLLDTGATRVSIPAGLASRLGLKRGAPGIANTANGQVTVYSTTLDSVSLGGITQQGVRGSINPGMDGEEILLGMTFLKHLELVQRGDTLLLRVP